MVGNGLQCLLSTVSSLRTKGPSCHWELCSTQVISVVDKRYLESCPKTGARCIKLLHNNASSHRRNKSPAILKKLDANSWSPSQLRWRKCLRLLFFLKLKWHLSGKNFDTRLDIVFSIHKYLKYIPEEEYKKTFHCWIDLLKRCIHAKGEYFENI